MALTEAQKKARDKWNAKFVDVKFRMTKEKKEQLQQYAQRNGESVNATLTRLMEEAFEKETLDK